LAQGITRQGRILAGGKETFLNKMQVPFFAFLIEYFGRTWWAPTISREFERFIRQGEKVLDIGAGGGWTGELIGANRDASVTLVDVADFNKTKLPLVVYDGTQLPFFDNSFDACLLLFVLHHCKDPLQVLKETIRVSKKRIIIYEDTYTSFLEKRLCAMNDFLANFPFLITDPVKMNMPYNYKTVQAWEEVFEELGLKVVFKRVTSHFITKHVLFVLEK
jgi:ubiquinone/menaquinone biosynthesis C-methylase UbiE